MSAGCPYGAVCGLPVSAVGTDPAEESARIAIVPYGAVSDKIEVELRVGFYNSGEAGTVSVALSYQKDGVVRTLGAAYQAGGRPGKTCC